MTDEQEDMECAEEECRCGLCICMEPRFKIDYASMASPRRQTPSSPDSVDLNDVVPLFKVDYSKIKPIL